MARTTATNFTGGLQFPYATAGTDIFKKEDVQTLALAVDGHDHSAGKGLALAASAIPNGSITSAMIADGTIATADLAAHAVSDNIMTAAPGSFPGSGSSTTSTSMVDIAGQNVSFTCTGGPVFVFFVGTLFMAPSQQVSLGIRMDAAGVSLQEQMNSPSGGGFLHDFTLFGIYQPAAGVHTWTATWAVSTGTVAFGAGNGVVLSVMELKR